MGFEQAVQMGLSFSLFYLLISNPHTLCDHSLRKTCHREAFASRVQCQDKNLNEEKNDYIY